MCAVSVSSGCGAGEEMSAAHERCGYIATKLLDSSDYEN